MDRQQPNRTSDSQRKALGRSARHSRATSFDHLQCRRSVSPPSGSRKVVEGVGASDRSQGTLEADCASSGLPILNAVPDCCERRHASLRREPSKLANARRRPGMRVMLIVERVERSGSSTSARSYRGLCDLSTCERGAQEGVVVGVRLLENDRRNGQVGGLVVLAALVSDTASARLSEWRGRPTGPVGTGLPPEQVRPYRRWSGHQTG